MFNKKEDEDKKKKANQTPDASQQAEPDDGTTQDGTAQNGGNGADAGNSATQDAAADKQQEPDAGQEGVSMDRAAAQEGQEQTPAPTIETLLADPALRQAFDAKVQEVMAKAKAEEEKLSMMSPDERAGYEAAKKEHELEEREKALAAREMKAGAIEELAKAQLPAALADCFNYESAETYAQTKDAVIAAFRNAMQEAVNARLRGSNTPKTAPDGATVGNGKAKTQSFSDIIKQQRSRR